MIGDHRKIAFAVTIGSKWVDGQMFPQGGTSQEIAVEFDQKTEDPIKEAVIALAEKIDTESWNIQYWWWLS